MDKLKDFVENINWKRTGKVALVIIPVLVWEAWYNAIKFIANVNEKINKAGDGVLSDFMNK